MGKKTRILILDDEPIVSKRLKPSLEKKGVKNLPERSTRAAGGSGPLIHIDLKKTRGG